MKPRKSTYIAHRWIGLIISLQLLAWSIGGLVFSVLDINEVRGSNDSKMISMVGIDAESVPAVLQGVIDQLGDGETMIGSIHLINRGLGAYWEIRDIENELLARVGLDGQLTELISPEQAQAIALEDFIPEAEVRRVELIEENQPSEYRGGPLPVYRVDLDHPKNPHIYVDATTGRINARRNDTWRTFDFFWMLHIMDYKDRDNFNHSLLIIASVFAVAASGTGIMLWGWRLIPKYFRRRQKVSA